MSSLTGKPEDEDIQATSALLPFGPKSEAPFLPRILRQKWGLCAWSKKSSYLDEGPKEKFRPVVITTSFFLAWVGGLET